jgi:hypothetical protein
MFHLLCLQNKAEGAFQSGADALSGKSHEAKRAVDGAGQDASGALHDAKKTADSKAKEVRQQRACLDAAVCGCSCTYSTKHATFAWVPILCMPVPSLCASEC